MKNVILEVENITAGYKNHPVLDGINLQLQRGKIYSVIGPNGCGKTTLLRVMSRNMKPISGRVLLDGKDIFKTNTKLVARKMAILSQSNTTMSDVTVEKLVAYGRYAHKQWWEGNDTLDKDVVTWALRRTNLEDFRQRKINSLSGGERQRAWIAMSLAQKPEILLLDEPTTYLDISHQLEIMELVSRLNREEGITVLMVLHDINHALRYSDELIVMNGSGIYQTGAPWELLQGDLLRDVFHVEAEITREEESGKPIFYAKRKLEV